MRCGCESRKEIILAAGIDPRDLYVALTVAAIVFIGVMSKYE